MSGSGNKVGLAKDVVAPEKLIAGSKHCPYKLAVVGGGPSGCSVVIRAFRIGFGGELCGFCTRKPAVDKDGRNMLADAQFPFQSAGVCLIDQSTADAFGGGKLQNYIINANTWANKFVTNVMDDKPDVVPQETVTGTPFQRLGAAPTAVTLKGYGCKPAPLKMVGAFLRDAGAVVIDTLNNKYPDSSRCLLESSVTAMQQVMLPVPAQYEKDLPDKDSLVGSCVGWKLSISQSSPGAPGGKLSREIYAHKVVLATGGRQDLPRLPNPAHTRKLMSSDYVCTQKGLDDLRSRLVKAGLAANRTTPGRVVVIGGSHSAFSAVWLCLHRLNESLGVANGAAQAPAQESKGEDINQVVFCQSGICLVHKSSIKVFYSTKADADKDGYVIESAGNASASQASGTLGAAPGSATKAANAGNSQVSKSWIRGQIHPFGGLRGDAKELWRSARDGRETRVKLIQVRQNVSTVAPGATGLGPNAQPLKQQAIVEKLFDEAVVIVWACGYNTNLTMPVLDLHGAPVSMRVKGGQVEVDDHARIISASPTIGVVPAPGSVVPVLAAAPVAVPVAVEPAEPTLASVLNQLGGSMDSDGEGEEKAVSSDGDCATPSPPFGSPGKCASALSSPVATSAKVIVEPAVPLVVPVPASPIATLAPAAFVASPPLALRSSSHTVKSLVPPPAPVIEGLMGSGLGFGLQALLESGLPDGSSGRADGVAVYLKRGATLVLAQVLGTRVFGGSDIRSWEDRLKIIKKMQLMANASAVKSADGAPQTNGPGVSTSLDTGQSLLGSPSSKRPSTTAGVRNSFGGVGFGASGKETPGRGGSTVLGKAMANRQNSMEKASPKAASTAAATPGKPDAVKAFAFPDVQYDVASPGVALKAAHSPTAAARPATASSAVSPSNAAMSPKAAINFIVHSPEAQRCADLVDKVATLSAGLEHLQLQGARDFLAVPSEGSSKPVAPPATAVPVVPAHSVIPVSSAGPEGAVTNTVRSASPAAVPRAVPLAKATEPTTNAKPPIGGRSSSSGRSGSSATAALAPKAAAGARVVLTPLNAELQKRAAGENSSANATPRKSRTSSGSSSSTPRGSKVPSRPQAVNPTTSVPPAPAAVLRSNSLTNQTAVLKAAATSPRAGAKNVSPVPSGANRVANTAAAPLPSRRSFNGTANAGAALQGKTVKLELPSIHLNKRSQNQADDPAPTRARAPSISKAMPVDPVAVEKLVKANSVGSAASVKLSVIV
jgi:hypothetical protein